MRPACDVIFTHGGKWVEFVYSKPKFKKSLKSFFGLVVKVNIFFGTVIPTAAVEIQRQVIEQVESAAGVTVAAVDVVIQQLDEEFTEEDDEEGNVDSAVLNASQAAAMSGMPTIG